MPDNFDNLPDQNMLDGVGLNSGYGYGSYAGYGPFAGYGPPNPYSSNVLQDMLARILPIGAGPASIEDLKWALNSLNARLTSYAEYQRYYDGDHPLAFASEKFRTAFGQTLRRLVDNLCPKVVNVLADRLRVTGFTADLDKLPGIEDSSADIVTETKYGDQAWDIWKRNRMIRWAGVQVQASLTLGDAYGLVWPDPKKPNQAKIFIHRGDQMIVKYSAEDPNIIQFAMKWWTMDDGKIRVNMYYEDRIDRWYTPTKPTQAGLPNDPALFAPYQDDPDRLGIRIPNLWGRVPVFHFPNGVGPGMLGKSELQPAIPMQDALNMAVANLMVAMEFAALPQRWATGVETSIDEDTGKDALDQFNTAVDRLLAVSSDTAKFGEFSAANLSQILEVQEKFRVEIARVTSTPIHHINQSTNDAPSGESLKTAEAPLTAKQEDRAEAFGETYAEMMAFAMFIETGKRVVFETQWKDTVPRNSKDFLEGLQIKKDLGVTDKFIKKEMGYTPAEIKSMEQEKEVTTPQVGDALLAAFDSGQPTRPVVDTPPAVGIQPIAQVQPVAKTMPPGMMAQG